jgi:hypothetical protein
MLRRIPADDSRVLLLVVRRLPPPLSFGISNSMKHNSVRDTKVRIAAARRIRRSTERLRGVFAKAADAWTYVPDLNFSISTGLVCAERMVVRGLRP